MKVMVFPKRSLKKEVIVQSNLLKRKGKVKNQRHDNHWTYRSVDSVYSNSTS